MSLTGSATETTQENYGKREIYSSLGGCWIGKILYQDYNDKSQCNWNN